MSLDRKTIEKVAHLARLKIDEKAIPTYVKNLSNILDLVEKMNKTDTTQITPCAHPLDLDQPTRPDAITEHNQHADYQAIAPQTEAGLYLVPKVIDEAG